jgi:crotonobetainyl-CoA:carnitine CoA-transferase CaiB-like acyl-CoA transferase
VIDLSLLEPLHAILGADAALHQINGKSMMRSGNRSVSSAPRNVYETKDGKWLAVSGSMQAMALRIFRVIGRADMCDDPRYATNAARLQNVEEVDRIVGDAIIGRTLDENMELFAANDVTAGPVYDVGQFRADPHVQAREALVEMPDEEMGVLPMHNIIPRLSRTPGAIRTPAPTIGQHTDETLEALGLTTADIDRLKAAGAI